MSDTTPTDAPPPSPFRTTLVRVLLVQVTSLVLLGLVQLYYNR